MLPSSPDSDLAACRALMRGGSRSFFAASRLLPRRIVEPATALYAFCRLADDAIDEAGAAQHALQGLQARLELAYRGTPQDHAADRAFAAVVARYDMPRALPMALLDGFAWDAQARRYETLDDLLDYAARVAGSVGAMMAVLMGVRGADALARACDLGVAMQLTNIARDVGEDARAGRLYLPLAWLRESGVDAEMFLADPRFDARIGVVVARLLQVADRLYRRAALGVRLLPAACRPGIRAAGLIYADIGRVIAGNGHDTVSARARVTDRRKASLLGRSLLSAVPHLAADPAPALPACRYLVDAAVASVPRRAAAVGERVDWLFNLFERLHREQWEIS